MLSDNNSAPSFVATSETGTADCYDYSFDIQGGSSASRVAQLVGYHKTVLEIGCGPGSQSRVFRDKLGCEVVGIEIDPIRAEQAREFCKEVHIANLETDDIGSLLKEEKFDVVVCADVLEHLRKPGDVLRKLKRFLDPHGYIVISIPNITHASVVYDMIHGKFQYQATGLLDSTHVTFFSRASALSLIEDSGYRITEFQKSQLDPRDTEFKTNPITAEDKTILEGIVARNPDATTYQFVIKAQPLDVAALGARQALSLAAQEEIGYLKEQLLSCEAELHRLNAIVEWYEAPLIARIWRKLSHYCGS